MRESSQLPSIPHHLVTVSPGHRVTWSDLPCQTIRYTLACLPFRLTSPPNGAILAATPTVLNTIRKKDMTHTFAPDRYDTMPYRRCGRSGLLLPAISLGAWETFGGYRDSYVARECLFRAFDLGITHFDLANNYGTPPGNAEI